MNATVRPDKLYCELQEIMLTEIALGIATISFVTFLGYAAEKRLTSQLGFGPATGTRLHVSLTAVLYLLSLVVALQFFSDSASYVFMGMLCLFLTVSSLLTHALAGYQQTTHGEKQVESID
jgi:hypothetical protein